MLDVVEGQAEGAGELAGPRLGAGRAGPDADDQPGHDAGVDERRAFEQQPRAETRPSCATAADRATIAAAAPATKATKQPGAHPADDPEDVDPRVGGYWRGTCRAKKVHSPRNRPLRMYSDACQEIMASRTR